MSWCGGGEINATPGCVCRSRAISALTLCPGSWPPSPGLEPCAILICSSIAEARYSGVTPKRPEATCLMAELRSVPKRAGSSPPSPERDRRPSGHQLEQVPQRRGGALVDQLGEVLVALEAAALDGLLQQVRAALGALQDGLVAAHGVVQRLHDLRVGGVVLTAGAVLEPAGVLEPGHLRARGALVTEHVLAQLVEADTAQRRGGPGEAGLDHL